MGNANKINVQDVTWSGSTGWSPTNFIMGDGSFATPTGINVTGGTSISSAGTLTFTNSTGGTFSVSGLAQSLNISLNTIPKGTGTTLTNSTWGFTGNHLFPISNGSNIGASPSNYVGTVQLGGTLNYHNDLIFTDVSVGRIKLYAGGNLAIGFTGGSPNSKVFVVGTGTTTGYSLGITNNTGATIFNVRDDRRIIYTDGNEASGKTLTSDSNGVATWQYANRVLEIASDATPTINTDLYNNVSITGLSTDITSMTTNLAGAPRNFDRLMVRVKDDGTGHTITWGTKFTPMGVALPTTTVASKVLTVGFIYDTIIAKWGCVASAQEA